MRGNNVQQILLNLFRPKVSLETIVETRAG